MTLGTANVRILKPSQATEAELAAFQKLVLYGGEVNASTLPALVESALCLVVVRVDGQMVGVGGMKRPYTSHRADVFQWANTRVDPTDFPFELGWVFVSEAGRGHRFASRIVEALVSEVSGAKSYATSRLDNDRMHSSLKRYGYQPSGQPYPSKQSDQLIQLFLRE